MGPEFPIELVEEEDGVSYHRVSFWLGQFRFRYLKLFLFLQFDWEAAVREIDLACLKSVNPSSSSTHFTNGNGTKPAKRQSTLDRFIARADNKPPPPDPPVVSDPSFECGTNDNTPSVGIDPETAKTWIYPVNVPLRDYQFAITKTALSSNTLVALPTGLGKTLIAAVVMYNYFRWFPQGKNKPTLVSMIRICAYPFVLPGKIVFAAPSRPLVMQQIEACHNIVGIPQVCHLI